MVNELAYMRKHPPRCIKKHAGKPSSQLLAFLRENLGDESTAFAVKCRCGSEQFRISVAEGFGPVSVECSECAKQFVVFDPSLHGYDGELGHNSEIAPAKRREVRCLKCKEDAFHACCGFQYAGETDVLEDKSIKVKPEDLFGYFLLAGHCSKCGAITNAFDWECA